MNDNPYPYAGVAAIVLAILFPIYWVATFGFAVGDAELAFRADFLEINAWDLLFVVIGILEIGVYLALSKYFRDQINGGFPANMLIVMAFFVALFHSSVIVDLLLGMGLYTEHSETIIDVTLIASVVTLFLFTFALLAFSIGLLARFATLPAALKLFACGALIAGLLQLTVVLGVINIVLFPALMLVLAFHFLAGDQTVEVV
ncbi:hypothetical protein [Pseudidiomarina sp.]|uniref:hypothetical protein n=1 Tax=Pseudidiomarina sp. TaxID=2081707 RepID=UPI00299D4DD9|nr:hypothetical protein [Pseudidiomarina sp.]MDX1706620.1 hypothetical protein [Pseudidiomarina sp.]